MMQRPITNLKVEENQASVFKDAILQILIVAFKMDSENDLVSTILDVTGWTEH